MVLAVGKVFEKTTSTAAVTAIHYTCTILWYISDGHFLVANIGPWIWGQVDLHSRLHTHSNTY